MKMQKKKEERKVQTKRSQRPKEKKRKHDKYFYLHLKTLSSLKAS